MRTKEQKDWDGHAYFESNARVLGATTEVVAHGNHARLNAIVSFNNCGNLTVFRLNRYLAVVGDTQFLQVGRVHVGRIGRA